MAITSPSTFVRPIYAGSAIATVESKDEVKIFTVRAASWEAATADSTSACEVDAGEATEVGAGTFHSFRTARVHEIVSVLLCHILSIVLSLSPDECAWTHTLRVTNEQLPPNGFQNLSPSPNAPISVPPPTSFPVVALSNPKIISIPLFSLSPTLSTPVSVHHVRQSIQVMLIIHNKSVRLAKWWRRVYMLRWGLVERFNIWRG